MNAHIDRAVTAEGGDDLLGRLHRELGSYLAQRPAARRLDTAGADVAASYARLLDILERR